VCQWACVQGESALLLANKHLSSHIKKKSQTPVQLNTGALQAEQIIRKAWFSLNTQDLLMGNCPEGQKLYLPVLIGIEPIFDGTTVAVQ